MKTRISEVAVLGGIVLVALACGRLTVSAQQACSAMGTCIHDCGYYTQFCQGVGGREWAGNVAYSATFCFNQNQSNSIPKNKQNMSFDDWTECEKDCPHDANTSGTVGGRIVNSSAADIETTCLMRS
jgi:hypothetical protein